MAYTSWSVVFGEQPSAAKWNILGTNDASFNDGSGLNNISNPITANSAEHLRLVAGTNKLVKTTVLRQDNTTNTYQSGNTVILTGWGFIRSLNGTTYLTKTVTFGVTFAAAPIVLITQNSLYVNASDATAITQFTSQNTQPTGLKGITTTNFVAGIQDAAGSTNNQFGFMWMAIGEIA